MEEIKFHVEGLPPKKNGANSMWGNEQESERLVKLRKKALAKMVGYDIMKRNIHLTIEVCVGTKNDRSVGDLDTFVTGVCDGLMKATPQCKFCKKVWEAPENQDVRPELPIAIDDDSQVIGIQAAKITDAAGRQFYEVTLDGE
jgi:hypothetical protein